MILIDRTLVINNSIRYTDASDPDKEYKNKQTRKHYVQHNIIQNRYNVHSDGVL